MDAGSRPLLDRNGNAMVRLDKVPKALKQKAREFVLMCVKGEGGVKKLVEKIYNQAIRGNFRAQEMLMNYIFGRPTESVKIESTNMHEISSAPVVKIIADHLRLEKLERDAASAPTVIELDRVQEMESILNKEVEKRDTIYKESIQENQIPIYKESKETLKSARKVKSNGTPTRKHKSKRPAPKRRKK